VNNATARVLVLVEGLTERAFVNDVLCPHLYAFGYSNVSARLLGGAQRNDHRGGIRSWISVRSAILNHLKEDKGCLVTTMVDYYGMPKEGGKGWPGRAKADTMHFQNKAMTVQEALLADICEELGEGFNPARFVPYVMMHEFEGLLFSDCKRFAEGIGHSDLAPAFQSIRDQFKTPEEINDSPDMVPSKRVKALVPGYQKPLQGLLAVEAITLGIIRAECSHFRQWLERLEKGSGQGNLT